MNEKTRNYQLLLGIFVLLILILRLYYGFQTPNLTADSYFELRQAESIRNTGLLLYDDDLSFSGNYHENSPLYYYLLALFSLLFPIILAAKFVNAVLASLVIIPIFLITKELTNNKTALIMSFFSGFIPLFYSATINTLGSLSLSMILFFLTIFYFMKLEDHKNLSKYLISLILLVLTTPFSLILILGFIIYTVMLKLENIKIKIEETETMIFSTVFILWGNFLTFKNAITTHGFGVITQNIPTEIIKSYFQQVSFFEIIFSISIIPLILGIITIYHTFARRRIKKNFLIISFVISLFILLWLKLFSFQQGIIFFSFILFILASKGFQISTSYANKIKGKISRVYIPLIIIILFLTTTLPTIKVASKKIEGYDIKAVEWLKNTPENSTILGNLEEGNLISYFGNRRNVIDTNFLLAQDTSQRLKDVEIIYKTPFKTTAIQLLNKYEVDYILLTEKSKEKYGELTYVNDPCFELVYDKKTKIYKSECKIEND